MSVGGVWAGVTRLDLCHSFGHWLDALFSFALALDQVECRNSQKTTLFFVLFDEP